MAITKVAIFTEGQTEQLFVCEAIRQMGTAASYYIVNQRKNGKRGNLVKMDYGRIGNADDHKVYFQILNCDSDSQVLSTVREEYETLVGAGFTYIIGIRDARPIPREKLGKLYESISANTPVGPIEPVTVVAVMEIEAWIIAENSHFQRIHPSLAAEHILEAISVDIRLQTDLIDLPFETLRSIYNVAGVNHTKSKSDTIRTISTLDFSYYCQPNFGGSLSISPLISSIQTIFSNAAAA